MESLYWVVNVRDKCSKMKKEVERKNASSNNYQQCLLVKLLADRMEHYVQQWIKTFSAEPRWNSTRPVWEELLSVLNSGLQLIVRSAEKDSSDLAFLILGFKGELSEIIDDTRQYAQMINRFILHSLSLSLPKQSIVEKLFFEVELDCKNLLFHLDIANQQDKSTLINRLESKVWFLRGPMSDLLPLLKKEPIIIDDADLSIMELLGEGTFGKVQRAEWHKIPVAVKEFRAVNSFQDELKVFEQLVHCDSPHIVRMYGHSTIPNRKLVLLELMDKDMMKKIPELKETPLSHKLDLILQIAKAMRHLHNINVVHRDLKPANVLLKSRKDGSLLIKLSDFGISKPNFMTAVPDNTKQKGSEMYWAPEMEKEEGMYSKKVDVYSFGLMCFEILTAKIRKKGEKLDSLTDIPKKLKKLLYTCIKDNDAERPSFDDICDSLWLVKAEILMEVETEAIELKFTIGPRERTIRNILPKIIPTLTGKRAIYVLSFKSICRDGGYRISDLPIDNWVDILLDRGWWRLTASGVLELGVDFTPQLSFLGIYGQLKFLKDEGKKFNVYLGIGGWKNSECFSVVFSTETTRNTFVNSVLGLLESYPIFNGLAIDWKNYGNDGRPNALSEQDVDNLVVTIQALREELPVDRFMIALTITSSADCKWPIRKAIDLVDQVYVDLPETKNKEIATFQSALYPSRSSKKHIHEAVNMYLSDMATASKIFIMGTLKSMEYYARGMEDSSSDSIAYKNLPQDLKEVWDDEAKATSAHVYDPRRKDNMIHSYDNVQSMVEKAKYIKENGLGGILVLSAHSDFPSNHVRSVAKALHDNLTHS